MSTGLFFYVPKNPLPRMAFFMRPPRADVGIAAFLMVK